MHTFYHCSSVINSLNSYFCWSRYNHFRFFVINGTFAIHIPYHEASIVWNYFVTWDNKVLFMYLISFIDNCKGNDAVFHLHAKGVFLSCFKCTVCCCLICQFLTMYWSEYFIETVKELNGNTFISTW